MFVAKQRLTSSSKSREGEERFNGISHAVGNCVAELFVARSAMCASTHASLIGESLLSLRRKEMFVARQRLTSSSVRNHACTSLRA